MKKLVLSLILFALLSGLTWAIYRQVQDMNAAASSAGPQDAAPVEVGLIERGPITWRRTFSGTLEATVEFAVAPKIDGRIARLAVDLADPVQRGQIVAELDRDEYIQEVTQAQADLAVAQASLAEAISAQEIAQREMTRIETLRERGIASESQLDTAKANEQAKQAQLEVAKALVTRAKAAVEAARIRLGYTTVAAEWNGGDDQRVVSARFVDEGDMVSANTPLLSIVELDPITGVLFITEKDYARLRPGHEVQLVTDAYAGEEFAGRVTRIAPVFSRTSRQARVELIVDNADHRLKPGMFIRATIALETVDEATIVPEQALTTRGDQTGVFLVNHDLTVSWRPVTVGLREGERVQVHGEGLTGRVVTLGQQLIDHGSRVTIPEDNGDQPNIQTLAAEEE